MRIIKLNFTPLTALTFVICSSKVSPSGTAKISGPGKGEFENETVELGEITSLVVKNLPDSKPLVMFGSLSWIEGG